MKALLLLPFIALIASCALPQKFDPRNPETTTDAKSDEASFVTPPAEPVPPELLQPPTEAYGLGPGDRLDIEVLGEKGTRVETFVTPDGRLYYSFLRGIHVTGMTLADLKARLEKELTLYYKTPEVSLSLQEVKSNRVWVLGRLNAPGTYPLTKPTRLLEVISRAGGLFTSGFSGTTEELADLEHSFIIRDGEVLPVDLQKLIRHGDMGHNIYLRDRDYIYLPSALSSEIYVLGAVNLPRAVGFMNQMNLMTAIGSAQGLEEDADKSHVSIVRGSLVNPQVAVVNLEDVMRGKAPNFALKPGDIVQVHRKGAFTWSNLGKQAAKSFVTSIALAEGSRVVGDGSTQIGIGLDGKPTATLSTSTQATTTAATTATTPASTPVSTTPAATPTTP